jgi:hypothetical protein
VSGAIKMPRQTEAAIESTTHVSIDDDPAAPSSPSGSSSSESKLSINLRPFSSSPPPSCETSRASRRILLSALPPSVLPPPLPLWSLPPPPPPKAAAPELATSPATNSSSTAEPPPPLPPPSPSLSSLLDSEPIKSLKSSSCCSDVMRKRGVRVSDAAYLCEHGTSFFFQMSQPRTASVFSSSTKRDWHLESIRGRRTEKETGVVG